LKQFKMTDILSKSTYPGPVHILKISGFNVMVICWCENIDVSLTIV